MQAVADWIIADAASNDLFQACIRGEMLKIIQCLEAGADINQIFANTKRTLLHVAAMGQRCDIATLLVNRGADYNIRDEVGSAHFIMYYITVHDNACIICLTNHSMIAGWKNDLMLLLAW